MIPPARGKRKPPCCVLLAGALVLLPVFLFGAFSLAREVQLYGSIPNAWFDMDVSRVVDDWTSWEGSDRARAHPLYKFIALAGIPVNELFFGGEDRDAAGKILSVGMMTLAAVMAGWLTWLITGGSRRAAAVAMALFAASYSTLLLASFPDSASASAFTSLLPYIFLFHRLGRGFRWWEGVVWILAGLVCFGITVSQLMHWVLALAYRLYAVFHEEDVRARPLPLGKTLGALVGLLLVLWAAAYLAMAAKEVVFKGAEKHYRFDRIVERELRFVETEELLEEPARRLVILGRHFTLYNFVSPEPVLSEWYHRDRPERLFTSLSIREENLKQWPPWAMPLLASQIVLLVLLVRWHRISAPLLLLWLAVLSQFGMHYLYGREFIIYSPNWHTLLVVIIAAILSPKLSSGSGVFKGWLALHVIALLLFNLYSLNRAIIVFETDYPKDRVMEREEEYREAGMY